MRMRTHPASARSAPRHRWPLRPLAGILPIVPAQIPATLLAGVTLAALGIPEVLGYATIAGMPVVTRLYTILTRRSRNQTCAHFAINVTRKVLLPIAVFALVGSSRHLVVGTLKGPREPSSCHADPGRPRRDH